MNVPRVNFDTERFLSEFWQRKPCVLRRALPDFDPMLDGDDLAGLACEELAESRIVSGSYPTNDWSVVHGPFEEHDFAHLGDRNWTLLVQDVEKHYPPLHSLMARFDFLPTWRLDDLMVSFAAPGGSVGPHVDRYDVFLVQGQGRRQWGVTSEFDAERLPDAPLDVLACFEAEREWVLEPGDALYLPPGIAHHGVALEVCLTFSVGFRAPSAADLLADLGEAVQDDESLLYADPGRIRALRAGEIERSELAALTALMRRPLDDERWMGDFLARFLCRQGLVHPPAPDPDPPTTEDLLRALQAGARLARNPWTRLVWYEADGRARLFAAGEIHEMDIDLAQALCAPTHIELPRLDARSAATLVKLISAGHLVLLTEP